jgi:hypothetical protein
LSFRGIPLLVGFAVPLLGQYGGPAILARGDAPAAMTTPAISFRPFVEVTGLYDTGLAGVAVVNSAGALANLASFGVGLTWGISGTHSWRRTKIGLDYRGNYDHYTQQTSFGGLNQQILLGITKPLSRRVTLVMRNTAGTFSRDFGLKGLTATVPFDPTTTDIPRTDFFDNRTSYVTTQADLTMQKTARLSFNIGGDGSIVKRHYASLYDVVTGGARGDVHYRLSRRSTIGTAYFYEHYAFTGVGGGSDLHSVVGSYGLRVSRWVEISGYAGLVRMESKFVQSVPVDPIIASILGITAAPQIFHTIGYSPMWTGRLSRTFRNGVAFAGGGRMIVPGNGLFLTSDQTNAFAGYGYTGLRRWSFNTDVRYTRSSALANVSGRYADMSGGFSVSRKLLWSTHFVARYYVRQYSSADFQNYNRLIHEARIGFGYTPGDIPLRVW